MVQRSVRTRETQRNGAAALAPTHIPRAAAQVFALLLSFVLTGCPLSDNYFVDPNAGLAGSFSLGGGTHGGSAGTPGGGAGAGASAGGTVQGGNGGSGGASAGTSGDTSGTGGAANGGGTALGGSGGTGDAGGTTSGQAGAEEAGATGTGGQRPCVSEPEICDGVDNDCNDAIDDGGVCPQHCSARQHDGRVYVLCTWALAANGPDYATAESRCAGMGTELGVDGDFTLAFVESEDENAWLKDWIAPSTSVADAAVWMGANDIEEEYRWVWGQGANAVQFFRGSAAGGGTAVMGRFNDFGAGRPNSSNGFEEDCGAFDAEVSWQWNDRQCSNTEIGFVCEQQS